MSQPFVGEIRMFGGNFAPAGWAFCNGQTMAISENTTLFALIGTTYGGDGVTTFNLPDLQGRIPIHQGNGFVIGQKAGEENHTLTLNEIPSHNHSVGAATAASMNGVGGAVYGGGGVAAYKGATAATMNAGVVQNNSGGQPHDNMMPFAVVSFIISLFGIFPSQN
jgi:microcystin-dependent protein